MAILKKNALSAATSLKDAKRKFHDVSLRYVVEQTLSGNADGIQLVFERAGFLEGTATSKVGRLVWAYLAAPHDDGGAGLGSMLRWDRDASRFKLTKDWSKVAETFDHDAFEIAFKTPWYDWKRESASRAFNLQTRIKGLITSAVNAGVSLDEIDAAMAGALVEKGLKHAEKADRPDTALNRAMAEAEKIAA